MWVRNRFDLFPHSKYEVDVALTHLEQWIADQNEYGEDCGLVLEPDYQRGHVWDLQKRREYIEYILCGGEVARTLYFACDKEDYLRAQWRLVDGLQRLTSVREFFALKFGVFCDADHPSGHYANAIADVQCMHYSLHIKVVALKSRADELRLYLAINTKGTPHSEEELERVRALLREEENRTP